MRFKIIVTKIDKRMQVARGKKKTKFLFFTTISNGNLPRS